ncbi:MAG: proline--tRNA ligase [bacterium]|nr:proline--tRNA ligase [bacterium]
MRMSNLFLTTLREIPAEAETPGHRLMLRAGLIRKLAAGVYSFMPLGYRAMEKISNIVRQEMNSAGAQELLLPALQPAELWQESGRWFKGGKEIIRFKDRNDRDFCLGPTHEEVITDLVRHEVRSYRQLPLMLYQIQTKFRDELRPRSGVIRSREFIMKDLYSFDRDWAGLDVSYNRMYEAYDAAFKRCGLKTVAVEADPGMIGGTDSMEFMAPSDVGEDVIIVCDTCDYAANREAARIRPATAETEPEREMETVLTPDVRTISQLTEFLELPADRMVKTLVYRAGEGRMVAVLVRGDREVNEVKLTSLLNLGELAMAEPEEIENLTGAPVGFSGPVGLEDAATVVVDTDVAGMRNFVTGANAPDAHFINVNIGRDFSPDVIDDVKLARPGDPCPKCDGSLTEQRGIEIGHIFKLGTRYTEAMHATCLDENGTEQVIIMGCYGIGISRLVAAVIEQNHDDNGIIWPAAVAPYHVYIVQITPGDEEQAALVQQFCATLESSGIDYILDDRDERPGVKFKDADLIGLPVRAVIGPRSLEGRTVEIKCRRSGEEKKAALADAAMEVKALLGGDAFVSTV